MRRGLTLLVIAAAGCVGLPKAAPPPAEPVEAVDHLAMAADAMEQGNERTAAVYLSAHLFDHPDEAMTRAQLAELLFKQERFAEARTEFERFVATAQPLAGLPRKHLVHAHTRLTRIAEHEHDEYAERLNRGIGLLAVAANWDAAAANETAAKAVKELRAARDAKPHDARVNWYLYAAHTRLGQLSAARAAWKCYAAAPPIGLTPWEAEQASHATATLLEYPR